VLNQVHAEALSREEVTITVFGDSDHFRQKMAILSIEIDTVTYFHEFLSQIGSPKLIGMKLKPESVPTLAQKIYLHVCTILHSYLHRHV
jgi:hypothetical protein